MVTLIILVKVIRIETCLQQADSGMLSKCFRNVRLTSNCCSLHFFVTDTLVYMIQIELKIARLLTLPIMNVEVTDCYELYIDDSEKFFIEHKNEGDGSRVAEVKDTVRCSFCTSILHFMNISLKASVLSGTLFGLFSSLLWWIELSLRGYWEEDCKSIPINIRSSRLWIRIRSSRLLIDSLEIITLMFWPLLTIAPICSWSMIKESTVLFCCTIGGLIDVVCHLCCYIFGHYETIWQLYIGHVLFLVVSFIVLYKFARYRQSISHDNQNTIIITFKILVQIIVGFIISLPYNCGFLLIYQNSRPFVKPSYPVF